MPFFDCMLNFSHSPLPLRGPFAIETPCSSSLPSRLRNSPDADTNRSNKSMPTLTLAEITEIIQTLENEIIYLRKKAAEITLPNRKEAPPTARMAIAEHHLTGVKCGFEKTPLTVNKRPIASTDSKKIKYRNDLGQTWSGGRGRRPSWIVNALIAGKSLKQYSVFNSTLKSAGQYVIYP